MSAERLSTKFGILHLVPSTAKQKRTKAPTKNRRMRKRKLSRTKYSGEADLCPSCASTVCHTVADTACTLSTVRSKNSIPANWAHVTEENTQVKDYEFYVYNSYSHWAFLQLFLSVISSTEWTCSCFQNMTCHFLIKGVMKCKTYSLWCCVTINENEI